MSHRARLPLSSRFVFARAALCVAALGLAAACDEEKPPQRYRLTFEVYSDLLPLPGAELLIRARSMGRTDAAGTLQLELPGRDGLVVPVTVRCPEGTRGPAQPIDVTLRTLNILDRASALRGLVNRVNCPPNDRSVAVLVRTGGRANVPVYFQGHEVSRTDESGLAVMTFRVRPSTPLQLAMNTAELTTLRPQNPTRQFLTPDADDVLVWEQEFHEEGPAPSARPRPRPGIIRRIPVRIGPTRMR